jgi:hypothetical protein
MSPVNGDNVNKAKCDKGRTSEGRKMNAFMTKLMN